MTRRSHGFMPGVLPDPRCRTCPSRDDRARALRWPEDGTPTSYARWSRDRPAVSDTPACAGRADPVPVAGRVARDWAAGGSRQPPEGAAARAAGLSGPWEIVFMACTTARAASIVIRVEESEAPWWTALHRRLKHDGCRVTSELPKRTEGFRDKARSSPSRAGKLERQENINKSVAQLRAVDSGVRQAGTAIQPTGSARLRAQP